MNTADPTPPGPGCTTALLPPRPPRRPPHRRAARHQWPAATPQAERLRQAAALLGQERAPGADYYPADDEIIADWAAAVRAGGDDPGAWPEQLDRFLAGHLDSVRDLMLRARVGRAPARLLDELAAAVSGQLARVAS